MHSNKIGGPKMEPWKTLVLPENSWKVSHLELTKAISLSKIL